MPYRMIEHRTLLDFPYDTFYVSFRLLPAYLFGREERIADMLIPTAEKFERGGELSEIAVKSCLGRPVYKF